MLNDDVKKQSGGDSSTNLQAEKIVVHQHGLSYRDAKEIALDVYKENFLKLSADAAKVARERAEELTNNFLAKLEKESPDLADKFAEPGLQVALYTAQKAYATTGNRDLQNLLVDILVSRAKSNIRDLRQIVLDEALEVAPRLTLEHFDALTTSWFLTHTCYSGLQSREDFNKIIIKDLIPFTESLTESHSNYEYFEYVGCGSLTDFGGWRTLESHIKNTYCGFFQTGFQRNEIPSELAKLKNFEQLIEPFPNHETLFIFKGLDSETIRKNTKMIGIGEEFIEPIFTLLRSKLWDDVKVKESLLAGVPELDKVFKIWEKTPLRRLKITPVGLAIAQANFTRKVGAQLDLSIWVN